MDDDRGTDEPEATTGAAPATPHPDEVLDPLMLLRLDVDGLRVDINGTHAAVGEVHSQVAALRAEMSTLAAAVHVDPDAYDTLGVVHEQVWEVRRRVDALVPPASGPDLRAVGTRRLGKELARRLNPLRPAFWRRVGRSTR